MSDKLASIFALIDETNGRDPDQIEVGGAKPVPAALLYGERMTAMLDAYDPRATAELKIACRAQHLERWLLPRSTYPQTKAGYYAWRNEQKNRHAERVSALMLRAGYDVASRDRVASLVRKEGIKRDEEAQALEDVACLVFLQHYAADFAIGRDEALLIDILRKTLRKMSLQGHHAAMALQLHDAVRRLLNRALP